jgi:hypothetical protein
VGLASVVGDECSGGSAGEEVAEHPEGEGKQPLGDSLGQAAHGLGEVVVESHLALEVGEYRFDDEADPGLLDFGRWPAGETVALGVMSSTPVSLSIASSARPQSPLSQKRTAPACPQARSTTASRSCPVLGPTSS